MLPPSLSLFTLRLYQGMLQQCQVVWMQEWSHKHLKTEISYFIEEDYSATVLPEDLR